MMTFKHEFAGWSFKITEDNWLEVRCDKESTQVAFPPAVAVPLVENLLACLRLNENAELLQ